MGSSIVHDTQVHQAQVPFYTGNLFIRTLLKNWPPSTRALWARVLCPIPESIKLGYYFGFPLDSRTKRRIYFSSPKIIFITPFAFQFSKKSFKKHKKKKKNIERLKFLGRKPGPEGGQIPHCTRILRHFSVNHRRWSVAWWVGHPSENAVVVAIRLNGVTIKLVQGS